MKFSKYVFKAVTPVIALFQKQHSCSSNRATTICGKPAESLRQVPIRHNRIGVSTEIKARFVPPTMCRLTFFTFHKSFQTVFIFPFGYQSLNTVNHKHSVLLNFQDSHKLVFFSIQCFTLHQSQSPNPLLHVASKTFSIHQAVLLSMA